MGQTNATNRTILIPRRPGPLPSTADPRGGVKWSIVDRRPVDGPLSRLLVQLNDVATALDSATNNSLYHGVWIDEIAVDARHVEHLWEPSAGGDADDAAMLRGLARLFRNHQRPMRVTYVRKFSLDMYGARGAAPARVDKIVRKFADFYRLRTKDVVQTMSRPTDIVPCDPAAEPAHAR